MFLLKDSETVETEYAKWILEKIFEMNKVH